jgi:hypothetical protein
MHTKFWPERCRQRCNLEHHFPNTSIPQDVNRCSLKKYRNTGEKERKGKERKEKKKRKRKEKEKKNHNFLLLNLYLAHLIIV